MKIQNNPNNTESSEAYNFPELQLFHHEDGRIATIIALNTSNLKKLDGCIIKLDEDTSLAHIKPVPSMRSANEKASPKSRSSKPASKVGVKPSAEESTMSTQDRYIDARLNSIEEKIDVKIDGIRESIARMQKGFDDAENRFEKASTRHDTEIALNRQQTHQEFRDSRRHAVIVSITTVFGVAAVIGIAASFVIGWTAEQGSYAKSYGETQLEIQRAADERAEFREAVQSIQATQQSILERLPPPASE